jgi:DNA-binding beta-propeller fold protein YncE
VRASKVLATFATAFALLCAPASAATRDVLLVGNSGDGTVDVFDAHSFQRLDVINAIPDGDTPRDPIQALAYPTLVSREGIDYVQDLALSPDGRVLYVSRGYLGDVAAFDMRTHAMLWRVEVNSLRADHLALSPDGGRLYVSALTSDAVEAIDTRLGRGVGAGAAGDWPHTIGFSADGRTLYSGSLGVQLLDGAAGQPPPTDGRHWLTALDPVTLRPERACELGAGIRPFALTPRGDVAYLQLSYYNGVVAYDPAHCRTLARLDLPYSETARRLSPQQYPNEAAQHGIALSPDGRWLCSAGTIDDYAALIALPAFRLAATIPVGQEPGWAVNSPDGRYCFVSSRGANANTVSAISYASRAEVARFATGKHPQVELSARIPAR